MLFLILPSFSIPYTMVPLAPMNSDNEPLLPPPLVIEQAIACNLQAIIPKFCLGRALVDNSPLKFQTNLAVGLSPVTLTISLSKFSL